MNKTTLLLLFLASSSVFAVTYQESLIARTAGMLASADFAREKCKDIKIDDKNLASLIKQTGKSMDELRKNKDYVDQTKSVKDVEKATVPRWCANCCHPCTAKCWIMSDR